MQAGLLMVFQNFQDGISDRAAWERDIYLAGLAEPHVARDSVVASALMMGVPAIEARGG